MPPATHVPFACYGGGRLVDPRFSAALWLSGARELAALEIRLRLVVASACETGVPQGDEELDSTDERLRVGFDTLPWREAPDPWGILLAEVLLHRTRAEIVETRYPSLLTEFLGPRSVVSNPGTWAARTEAFGLRWRADAFVTACHQIVDVHGGQVPRDLAHLTALPGVGQYVASAVRCFAFGTAGTLVDTNTMRLAARLSGHPVVSLPAERQIKRFGRDVVEDYSTSEREYAAMLFPLSKAFDARKWRVGFERFWKYDEEKIELWNEFDEKIATR